MMFLAGNGRFDYDIVGESFYQTTLCQLAGLLSSDGCDIDCLVVLVFEDVNKFDRLAVAAFVARLGGEFSQVGYLSRKNARAFRIKIAKLGGPDSDGMFCRAKIVGGWLNDDGSSGPLGVKLDLHQELYLRTQVATSWASRLI